MEHQDEFNTNYSCLHSRTYTLYQLIASNEIDIGRCFLLFQNVVKSQKVHVVNIFGINGSCHKEYVIKILAMKYTWYESNISIGSNVMAEVKVSQK